MRPNKFILLTRFLILSGLALGLTACGGGGGDAAGGGGSSSDDPVPVIPGKTQSFTYDALSRLSVVTYDDGTSITYGYDATGNVISRTVAAAMP